MQNILGGGTALRTLSTICCLLTVVQTHVVVVQVGVIMFQAWADQQMAKLFAITLGEKC